MDRDPVPEFGARVRALRTERGWTQAELSRRASTCGSFVNTATISRLETRDHKDPTLSSLIGLATAFRMSLDELVGFDVAAMPVEPVALGASPEVQELREELRQVKEGLTDLARIFAEASHDRAKELRKAAEQSQEHGQPGSQPQRRRKAANEGHHPQSRPRRKRRS